MLEHIIVREDGRVPLNRLLRTGRDVEDRRELAQQLA
jgi:hypothetical protein